MPGNHTTEFKAVENGWVTFECSKCKGKVGIADPDFPHSPMPKMVAEKDGKGWKVPNEALIRQTLGDVCSG